MKLDFCEIHAPEALKADTVAKMRQQAERHRRPARLSRRIAVCAAALAAVFVLVSAGTRVFDYLAYVPGQGIATVSREGVYTLERVAKIGSYTIDGVSFVPGDEGTAVTVTTDKPTYRRDNEIVHDTMTLTAPDGTAVTLTFAKGTDTDSTYTGTITGDTRSFAGELTLSWLGSETVLSVIPLDVSPYADCTYPICDGLTLVAFPTAEGSRRIVYGVELDPESENFAYWASVSGNISAVPCLTAIDSAGNEYTAHSYTAFYSGALEDYFGTGLHYAWLDTVPENPIAGIRVDSLRLKFQRIDPTTRTPVTVTVPENGETVETDIPLVADHGILATVHSLSGGIDADGKPELTLEGTYPTLAFDESATGEILLWFAYAAADTDPENPRVYGGGAWYNSADGTTGYHIRLHEEGRDNTLPATYGDDVNIYLTGFELELTGDWGIVYTAAEK